MLNIIIFIITIYISFFSDSMVKKDFIAKIIARFNVEDVFFDNNINFISRDKKTWFNEMKIDLTAVEDGDLIVSNGYLVGMVTDVLKNNSVVELITNNQKKLSVKIDGEYYLIDGYEDGYLIIKTDREVDLGLRVATSGMDYIYPPGILVGTVFKIEDGKLYVKTEVDFNNLRNLEIMKR